jgi:hypothetical protein
MHRICDYNFQIIRHNGRRATPRREMAIFSELNLGKLAKDLNTKLKEVVVYPRIRNMFSLLCVEYANGISSGWNRVNIDIPGTILRFHFILDRNLMEMGKVVMQKGFRNNGVIVKSTAKRHHVLVSNISPLFGGGNVLTIGLSAKELGSNYEALGRTLGECELLYKILGMTTKAFWVYGGEIFNDSEHIGTVLSTNSPDEYHKCLTIWRQYPNLIPDLSEQQSEYVLQHIQKNRRLKDLGNGRISVSQRSMLGLIPQASYKYGLVQFIYEALKDSVTTGEVRKCLEICFANFNSTAKSYEQFVDSLWSYDEATTKQRIYDLIWSSHERN